MKQIILDYFQRWWLALTSVFIAYFIFQAISIRETTLQTSGEGAIATVNHTIGFVHNMFIFQVVMWLGFLSMFDLQRGAVRTLTILPLTMKQIGRALWLASVLLPGLALLIIGILAFFIFSSATNKTSSFENYFTNWILSTLYLGAIFGARTLMTTGMSDTFVDRIRTLLPNLLFAFALFGLFFLQMQTLIVTKATMIFIAYLILFIVGWFRAETLVVNRAGFHLAAQPSKKQPVQYKISKGFNGIPFLMITTLTRTLLLWLAIIAFMALFAMLQGQAASLEEFLNHLTPMTTNGFIFWWIIAFQTFPILMHLRFLRTLPLSTTKLAIVLIGLPMLSMLILAIIFISLTIPIASVSKSFETAGNFLMPMAFIAWCIPLAVWQGFNGRRCI
ncbi:MAG: hypothetical protein WDM76_06855 [Limisphaerales bacterium]